MLMDRMAKAGVAAAAAVASSGAGHPLDLLSLSGSGSSGDQHEYSSSGEVSLLPPRKRKVSQEDLSGGHGSGSNKVAAVGAASSANGLHESGAGGEATPTAVN